MKYIVAATALTVFVLGGCAKKPSASASTFPGSLSIKVSNLKTVLTSSYFLRDIMLPLLLGSESLAHNGTAGSPTALSAKFYAAYASANKDCTDSVLLEESVSGITLDLFANPELFAVENSLTAQCLIFKLSDQLSFKPDATAVSAWSGVCLNDTSYVTDFYQSTSTAIKDRDGNLVAANGADGAPVEDALTIFVSTDTAAVTAGPLGITNSMQLRTLPNAVSSGVATFYADFSNHLNSRNSTCILDGHGPFGVR